MDKTWKNVLDRMEQEVIVTDHEGRVIWGNRYARNAVKMDEWEGRKFASCFAEQEAEDGEMLLCSEWGDTYSYETEACEDGTIYFLDNLTSFDNPRIQRECYKEIVEKLDVMGSDAKGEIVIVSKMAAQYYGMSREELYHRSLADFYHYRTEDEQEHSTVIETGVPILDKYSDNPSRAKNYVYRPLMYSTYPFAYHGRNILAYTIIQDDKKAQETLREITELKRRLRLRDLKDEKYKEENDTSYSFLDIVGESKALVDTIRDAQTIAVVDRNLLIVGETGTGKEVFAQSIHNFSKRNKEPFIPVNCAAIPENLLESILFGTVRGAYTGAVDSEGLFELAKNGTLFLDELNSMQVSMQTKLLRVLQERKAMRVGGHKMYPINCRIISAINEDPQVLMETGKLRSDLFYRIAPLSLYIPSLRERPQDILAMARYFIEKYNKVFYKDVQNVSTEMERLLLAYPWPGNVRELDYVIENMMIRAEESELKLPDLPRHLQRQFETPKKEGTSSKGNEGGLSSVANGETETTCGLQTEKINLLEALALYERNLIEAVLDECGGNQKKAAERLGISRQNMHYRLKRLDACKKYDT